MPDPIRHIATYARVSSDEQRDRHTVRNQRAALSRRLGSEPGVLVFKHYEDDGVSGTIPLQERPGGCALVRDARAGRFSQVWVVRADRLGRDAFELLRIWRVFESIGVALRATDENIDDPFYFDIHAVIAANERRKFLERSAEGMNRAAKEGRYTGGIVPLGYSVSGDRGFRRLVPDDSPMWAGLSAADVVRRIYDHLAVDGWSCVRIATEFNSLGVPTSYRRDGRGVRGKRTQGLWRSGRIRNLVVNPVYRGVLQYGRRSTKPNGREVISASVSPLVSEDVWDAAIATLKRNRALPRNSRHAYLLRSLIRCAVCGLSFCGTWTRGPRYRCNGSMAHRGPFAGKCIGASIKGEQLEAASGRMSPASLPTPTNSRTSYSRMTRTPRTTPSQKPNAPRSSTLAPQPNTAAPAPSTSTPAPSSRRSSSTPSPQTWNRNSRGWTSGWPISNPRMTLLTTPSPRMCSRRSVSGWTTTSQTPSAGRSFSCSSAGLRSTPPSPTAAASRSAWLSTTASRREVRLARASLRVTATISPALSPPDAHTSSSPTFSGFNGRRQSLSVPVSQHHRCGEDIPQARVRLRSTAPALLLQSPVQRAGRVIGFPDAERRAAARNGWEGHSSLFITLLCLYKT